MHLRQEWPFLLTNLKKPMSKVTIALAPVGYGDINGFHTAKDLAEEICACCEAGASLVHLHVTDETGAPTANTSYFQEVVDRIRSGCDIIIEGSTGGVGVSEKIRSIALEIPDVQMGSLNMGSCNLFGKVYENPPGEIERIALLMKQRHVAPDMCFFEPGFVEALAVLRTAQLVRPPYVGSICLGFPGALPATVENLCFMVGKLPPEAVWTLVHHGSRDFSLMAAAIACGGNVRVGFEDSRCLGTGHQAACNRQLVEKARDLVRQLGRDVATSAETRERFGIRNEPLPTLVSRCAEY